MQADTPLEVVYAKSGKQVFVYKRGEITIILNPSVQQVEIPVAISGEVIYNINGKAQIKNDVVVAPALSFSVVK